VSLDVETHTPSEAANGKVVTTDPEQPSHEQALDSKATKPPKQKRVRTAPEGTPIPTMGVPGRTYWLLCLVGRPDIVPRLTMKETRHNELKAEVKASMDQLSWLKRVFNTWAATVDGELLEWTDFALVVAFFNEKGGSGKSTDAVLVGNFFAKYLGCSTLIMPIAANDGSTASKAATEDKNTKDLIHLEKILKNLTQDGTVKADANVVKSHLHKNEAGAYVLAQNALPSNFGGRRLRWIMDQLKPMFQIIIEDTGNDIARYGGPKQGLPLGGNVIYEAGYQADILVFPCSTSMPDSYGTMGKSMDSFVHLRDPDKLSRSIVVVNGHRPSDPIAQWVMFAENRVNNFDQPLGGRQFNTLEMQYRVSKHSEGHNPKGKLVLIPWEDFLKNNSQPDFDKLRPATQRVIQQLVYEIVVRAGQHKGVNFSILDQIRAADEEALKYDPFGGLTAEQVAANLADSGIVSDSSTPAR
jgi:hypothetical protein